MANAVVFIQADEDGAFEGFAQSVGGRVLAEYRTAAPVPVERSDILQVEITSPTTCVVVNIRRPTAPARPPSYTPARRIEMPELIAKRPRTKKQKPLTSEETAAIALQAKVEAAERSEQWMRDLDARQCVRAVLAASNLSPREERVIRLRFMNELELRAIGEQFGVTSSRIREIESRSLRKMKRAATVLARQGVI